MEESKLSFEQVKVVSSIFSNLGHIFFASLVIPFFISSIIPGNAWIALFGLFVAIWLWVVSIVLVEKPNPQYPQL